MSEQNKTPHSESYDQQIIGKMFYYRKVGSKIIKFRIAKTEITNNNQIKIFNDTGNQSFLIHQGKISYLLAYGGFHYNDCRNEIEAAIGVDEKCKRLIGRTLIQESVNGNDKQVLGKITSIQIGTFVVYVNLEGSKECISLANLCTLTNNEDICHSTSEGTVIYYTT